jgi:hypothetical protein
VRSVVAAVLPVLAAAFVYAGVASAATPDAWLQSSLLVLPAMLVSILVVALLFLPLWSFLVHRTTRIRRIFVAVNGAALVVICSILVATGVLEPPKGLQTLGLMLGPGMVLIIAFGLLMDSNRVRGGRRPNSKQEAP